MRYIEINDLATRRVVTKHVVNCAKHDTTIVISVENKCISCILTKNENTNPYFEGYLCSDDLCNF